VRGKNFLFKFILMLVYGLHLRPRPTRVLLAVMSTTGVAELCYSATEWLDWNARAARRNCRD